MAHRDTKLELAFYKSRIASLKTHQTSLKTESKQEPSNYRVLEAIDSQEVIMPPPLKRVQSARHNGCGDCAGTKKAKEIIPQIEELKQENQRLQEENRQLAEKSERFPELLAVWRNRYEEAMNKNLNRVLMHSGDVFIPMGVHLREMKTVETWKRRHEVELKRRKDLEGFIEKWKKNNNQLRKDLEAEQKAHKRSKKMLEMFMPDGSGPSRQQVESSEEKEDSDLYPMPISEIKEEVQEDPMTLISSSSSSTTNELLTKFANFQKKI